MGWNNQPSLILLSVRSQSWWCSLVPNQLHWRNWPQFNYSRKPVEYKKTDEDLMWTVRKIQNKHEIHSNDISNKTWTPGLVDGTKVRTRWDICSFDTGVKEVGDYSNTDCAWNHHTETDPPQMEGHCIIQAKNQNTSFC